MSPDPRAAAAARLELPDAMVRYRDVRDALVSLVTEDLGELAAGLRARDLDEAMAWKAAADGDERDTEVVRHWGVRFPGVVRWNPGYGSGIYIPYTEAQARADAAASGGELVTRVETTVVVTGRWQTPEEAAAPPKAPVFRAAGSCLA